MSLSLPDDTKRRIDYLNRELSLRGLSLNEKFDVSLSEIIKQKESSITKLDVLLTKQGYTLELYEINELKINIITASDDYKIKIKNKLLEYCCDVYDEGVKDFLFRDISKVGFSMTSLNKDFKRISDKLRKIDVELDSEDDREVADFIGKLKIDVRDNLLLKKRDNATELIVNYILSNNHIYSMRDDNHREMWIYKEGIYIPEAVSYINELCLDVLGVAYTPNLCNNVIAKIEVRTYIDYISFFEVKDPYSIAVKNGILNLKTFKLGVFTPKKIFFNKINAEYDTKHKCPNVEKFFSEILPDGEDVVVMQEIFGFCLVKDYFVEKAFMFNGTGRNGKGKTLDLLTKFLGEDNVCNISLENIRHDDFFMCNLQNRMANIGGDISDNKLKSTNAFKSVTGRDYITANRKGKSFIKFKNFAKMIFACNKIPDSNDNSDGFFMRWIVLNFPFKFIDEKDFKDYSEDELEFCKKQDNNLIDKITTVDELNGVLNWSLIGLKRLLIRGSFSYNKSSNEVKEIWKMKSNSFDVFCDKNVEYAEYDEYIEYQELKKKYGIFCKKHRVEVSNEKNIKKIMLEKYGASPSRMGLNNITVYKGVILK